MTMNLTASSAKDNREFIATDSDPADVADAEAIFNADYTSTTITLNGKLVVSPSDAQPVDPRTALHAHREREEDARHRDSVPQRWHCHGRDSRGEDAGVSIRVVTTASGDNEETPAELDVLHEVEGQERAHRRPRQAVRSREGDRRRRCAFAFVGSQNFTPTALFQNREAQASLPTQRPKSRSLQTVIAQDFAAGTAR